MNITILNIAIETKPTTKGSYQVADVAYKNNSFGGKVEGKKVMSFGATKEAFNTLAVAQPGESYEVNIVKNDKGYNDWVSMQKAGAQTPVANPSAGNAQGVQRGSSTTQSPRSTYETPEERAKRQVYIVRQSSISAAISILSIGAKVPLKKEDVLVLAKQLETFVFDNTGATGFDDIPTLDPSFVNTEPQID